ncbi:hypothetical protein X798_05235 [Onchocerca flexuosa]|uniref:Uncharacterized protein n=1 Tax=Onchocerca flexuosa TaxID=387005 RepID=A0A238BSB1_9BILA|nr:hypothetical protein X798_05235 [Onchocerca flexuosa]
MSNLPINRIILVPSIHYDTFVRSLDDSREQSSGDSGHFQIDFPNALPALIQSMQQQLYLNNPAVSQYANSIPRRKKVRANT